MRIELSKRELHNALSQLVKIAPKTKVALPILETVRIHATQGKTTLTATDLETSVRLTVEGDCRKAGSVCVNARALSELVKKLPASASITLEVRDGNANGLWVSADNGFGARLYAMPDKEFPAFPSHPERRLSMKGDELARWIGSVAYAVSDEESRYFLNGVYLDLTGKRAAVAATDSRRLALNEGMELDADHGGYIVPTSAVQAVVRLYKSVGGSVAVHATDNLVTFRGGGIEVACRPMEGEYPAYRQIVPKHNPYGVLVDRAALVDAVNAVGTFTDDKTHAIRVVVRKDSLSVRAAEGDKGAAVFDVDALSDCVGTFGVNAKFLKDALTAFTGNKLTLWLKEPLSAMLWRDESNPNHVALVMPMKVDDAVEFRSSMELASAS